LLYEERQASPPHCLHWFLFARMMAVQHEQRREYRRFDDRAVVSVRLIKKLAEVIDDIDLSQVTIGDVLTLPSREARLLIAEGWAVPESPATSPSHLRTR